jgi:hypothetical protein
LPYENYFSLGHKHLARGNRRCGKRRVNIHLFSKELRAKFMLETQSGGRPSILQQVCITKIISVWGINISFRVIEDVEKEG